MTRPAEITNLEQACLQCLAYFGIFSYPLTAEEIHRFSPFKSTQQQVQNALNQLVERGIIFKHQDFYLDENNPAHVHERIRGNLRAMELLKSSRRYVKIIAAFPFVKSIAISGSLSKFYSGKKEDIDYFIITEADRLWIARTLLHLFKKLTFVTGQQHFFCMNYFIDTKALALEQRNQYVAIELVTLLPAFNDTMIMKVIAENSWVRDFVPNHPGVTNLNYLVKMGNHPLKTFLEKAINLFNPGLLNRKLMALTDRKWRKKWKFAGFHEEEYNKALQTELHISKNHPEDFQKKVLEELKKQHNPSDKI
jgi:hypothetical protein